ncbi:MAG TPA: ABC transporter ATP-binding protein [Dehalococcoidia bacterium]|nr:ABC transporter ATP-binding protein [Dehalococcoidia bacterium]
MAAPLLRVRGLTKTYGRLRALSGVSFDVNAGEVVAVLGANGAGKTTIFRCILGITSFEGDIEVDGLPVPARGKDVRRRVGYVPQVPDIADGDTAAGLLAFIAELRGIDQRRVGRALDSVGLRPQANTPVANLSGGMKQRLAFAAALLADPPLLLLDEPTSSMDIASQAQFHEILMRLRQEGKTALIATHYANRLTALADRAIVLDSGRLLYAGSMKELLERRARRSFLVSINGTSVDAFTSALATVGVGPERIRPAEVTWEEVFADLLGAGVEGGGR